MTSGVIFRRFYWWDRYYFDAARPGAAWCDTRLLYCGPVVSQLCPPQPGSAPGERWMDETPATETRKEFANNCIFVIFFASYFFPVLLFASPVRLLDREPLISALHFVVVVAVVVIYIQDLIHHKPALAAPRPSHSLLPPVRQFLSTAEFSVHQRHRNIRQTAL